jgi:PEP-CTERM motif
MKVMLGVMLLAFTTHAAADPILLDQVSFDRSLGAPALQDMNSRQAFGNRPSPMTPFSASAMNMETLLSVQRNLGIADPSLALANQVQAFQDAPGGVPLGACDEVDNCSPGSTVPEPATLLTLGASLLGASLLGRSRKKA